MNSLAASSFWVPAGMASVRAQSRFDRFSTPSALGASAKPTLSATVDSSGLVTKDAATVASIHSRSGPAGTARGSR